MKKRQSLIHIDNTIKIDPVYPLPDIVKKAAILIKAGGIIGFPTRCLYGIGADAFNVDAVDKVFLLKKRPRSKPLSVLINSRSDLVKLVRDIPLVALEIMDRFWPGRITIVFDAKNDVPENLISCTGKIGIRQTGHNVVRALLKEVNIPITGTSANLSGSAGCFSVERIDPLIANRLDLIIDAGSLKGGIGSTVIDVTTKPPRLLREGEVSIMALSGLGIVG